MTSPDTLTASLEDYLETIFRVIEEKEAVRPKDIARRLKVSNASVTGALRSLAEKGLINYAPYDVITLTAVGKRAAQDVARRHEILRDFFVRVLAIDEAEADEGACRMEHAIPKSILERLVQFAEFVDVCPRGGAEWVSGFRHYCTTGDPRENCERCLVTTLGDVRRRNDDRESQARALRLADLEPGQRGKITKITVAGYMKRRMSSLGIQPGAVVEMERNVRDGDDGDALEIKVKGYHHSLRRDDVNGVEIEAL